MQDLVFLLFGLAGFAACLGYVKLCAQLLRPAPATRFDKKLQGPRHDH